MAERESWVNKKSSLSNAGYVSKSGVDGHNNIPICQIM